MALIGLFCANHPSVDGGGEPAALLAVGGITLLERNLRLALKAGAERLIVLADDAKPATTAELSALCQRYPQLDVVNHAEDLTSRIANDDRVLLIEEGFAVDMRLVQNVCAVEGADAAMAVWQAGPAVPEQAVRLTAQFFSASVSVVQGLMVRRVAKGLGEWDFEQTLLRATMAELAVCYVDAAQCGGYDPAAGREIALLWHAVQSREAAGRVTKLLADATDELGGDAPTRWIYAPLARWVASKGTRLPLDSRHVAFAAVASGGVAAVAFAGGWMWLGCILALLAAFGAELSRRLERVRLDPSTPDWVRLRAPSILEAAWYAGLCIGFMRSHGMAALAVALLLLVCRFSADLHRHYHLRLFQSPLEDGGRLPRLLGIFGSGRQTNIWLLSLCGLFGAWYPGFWVVSGYAAASYAVVLGIFIFSLKQMARNLPQEEIAADTSSDGSCNRYT